MAMLRTLDRRGTMPDVLLVYSSPSPERMIFRAELQEMAGRHERLRLHEQHTDTQGLLTLDALGRICPDWQERQTWACGPAPMLDAAEEFWEQHGLRDRLHLERFTLKISSDGGEGGTIRFLNSGKEIEADGATTLLEAGEKAGVGMPYGCRMGICHTCTITMSEGRVRDLRSGEEHFEPNESIQTCTTVAVGDCTLNI
jgi:ferredoxin-NADP reductase